MNDLTVDPRALLDRIERFERKNFVIQAAGLALLIVAAGVLINDRVNHSREIRAREFLVQDRDGKERVRLRAGHLFFEEPDGRPRATLAANDNEAVLLLAGKTKNSNGAYLDVERDGSTSLVLADQKGKNRDYLSIERDGSTALVLSDHEGKTRISIQVDAQGNPTLSLYDKDGKAMWWAP
jgi:hypothetical protein